MHSLSHFRKVIFPVTEWQIRFICFCVHTLKKKTCENFRALNTDLRSTSSICVPLYYRSMRHLNVFFSCVICYHFLDAVSNWIWRKIDQCKKILSTAITAFVKNWSHRIEVLNVVVWFWKVYKSFEPVNVHAQAGPVAKVVSGRPMVATQLLVLSQHQSRAISRKFPLQSRPFEFPCGGSQGISLSLFYSLVANDPKFNWSVQHFQFQSWWSSFKF